MQLRSSTISERPRSATLPPESERALRAVAEQLVARGSGLPAFQERTCARCGRQTTFALQDRAGWYACLACGRYA
jgi:hypothetical protein